MTDVVPELLPARILNEHVYCPRLAYLEWVDRQFTDSADTVEGRFAHRRVDRPRGRPPDAGESLEEHEPRPPSTSVEMASAELGLTAKLDLLEVDGEQVVPIEYKHGSPRSPEQPLWDPERVQLCAQALLLRANGYRVEHAEVYFEQSHTRHRVELDEELERLTLNAIDEARANAARTVPPPPLVDSPKCPRCSLVGICLPDEVNALQESSTPQRRLTPPDPPSEPLYLTEPGARLTKRGGRVVLIKDHEELASRRLLDIAHIAVFGNVTVGSAVVRACLEAGTPILWFSAGGWFTGLATGMPAGNVELRMRQHRAAALGSGALAAAFVEGKIRNARTLLRRHGGAETSDAVTQLGELAGRAAQERELASLLGVEGTAARLYFKHFGGLLHRGQAAWTFDFEGRNRRPPRDPVNALLSFVYALLVKDTSVALAACSLDPYVGVFHRPRFGRPALALDLAEEFRPLIADSVVLTAINNEEVADDSFIARGGAVALTKAGRRAVIGCYERRMRTELTHPLFRYKTSYRRALQIQARLLGAALVGDVPAYRSLTTR